MDLYHIVYGKQETGEDVLRDITRLFISNCKYIAIVSHT